jgi:hypothetical protein
MLQNRWYSSSFKKFVTEEFGPDAYNSSGKDQSGIGDDLPGRTFPPEEVEAASTKKRDDGAS